MVFRGVPGINNVTIGAVRAVPALCENAPVVPHPHSASRTRVPGPHCGGTPGGRGSEGSEYRHGTVYPRPRLAWGSRGAGAGPVPPPPTRNAPHDPRLRSARAVAECDTSQTTTPGHAPPRVCANTVPWGRLCTRRARAVRRCF